MTTGQIPVRRLGADGPVVGAIGLGCMGMTYAYEMDVERDDPMSIAVIREAIDRGCSLIDTADVYGPYNNEELVGQALRDGWRDRAVIATKVGLVVQPGSQTPDNKRGIVGNDGRPEHVRASIDGSLRRLGVDHVDLYQLHRVDANVPLEETWGAMAEVVAAGKARWIGLSEVSAEQIATAHAIHPVTSVQSEFSLWTRDIVAEVMPFCEVHGIGLLPFSPLGRGFLAGRFSSFDDVPENDFRRALPRFQQEQLRANLAIVGAVRSVAERVGATPAQVALAWVLSKGDMIIPIPGTKRLTYLADNLDAVSVELSATDIAELDALPAPEGTRY
ncbi:MAG: aldo/keto reductase [Ilumatobacteraceae bacterium]